MGDNDQSIVINFSKGVDTKTDPWQLDLGKFLSRMNSVFTTPKRSDKRNGYGLLINAPDAASVTTYNGSLLAIGSSIELYSEQTDSLFDTGYIQPLSLGVIPLVRRASAQTTVDTAVAPNGLCCTTWLDSDGGTYYQIADSNTGAALTGLVPLASGIDVSAGFSRVFVLGNYFVVTYLATVSSTATLRYIAIPILTPDSPLSPVSISTQVSGVTAAYDGVVAFINPSILYLAWNGSDSGGAIRLTSLNATLIQGSVVAVASDSANLIATTWDYAQNLFWIAAYKTSATDIFALAYNQNLVQHLATTTIATSVTLDNGLTCSANNGVMQVFYEVSNFYGYDSTLRTDYLGTNTVTVGGAVGTQSILLRGIGISSKAFYLSATGLAYLLVTYSSAYQPTYFLIDQNGNVIGKLAYSNGGGYVINLILPQLNLSTNDNGNSVFQVGYLFKDYLESIANPTGPSGSTTGTDKTMGAANTAPVYAQTGINLATFTFNAPVNTVEAGSILHLGCGFPWMFDGIKPVEHQFHLWIDALEASALGTGGGLLGQTYYVQWIYDWMDGAGNPQYSAPSIPIEVVVPVGSGVGCDAVFSSGSYTITVSSATGFYVGQIITDVTTAGNIMTGTYITKISGSVFTLSQPTAGASASSPGDEMQVVATGSITSYVPTLRLTYKTANKVRLRGFRWSQQNQNFFEFTSITSPVLNDPTVDYITYVDKLNDLSVAGNSLIYTTGGTVEDIAAPSFSVSSMFDDRVWVLDAEDPYTLWYSKQVLEGTGVEFSDLFTYYVASNIGAQGPTGPITAIGPMDTELILFKKNAIYYVNGTGPDNTGANSTYSQPTFITSTVGCTNQNSVVLTDIGIMFQSDKGIWLVGRNLQASYIGFDVEAFNSYTVTSANVIPGTTQVKFTLEGNITLIYDYFVNEWGYANNPPSLSATLYNELHTYLDGFGHIVQETPGEYLDLSTPVLQSFTTSWINLASIQGYQRIYDFLFIGQYLSPHFLKVDIAYDYNPTIVQSSIFKPRNFSPSVAGPFGAPTPVGSPYSKEQGRVHMKKQLCESFQLTITEIFDPSKGAPPGAGFTMSGITARCDVKKSTRPIPGRNAIG